MNKKALLAGALSAAVTVGVNANEMSDQTNQTVDTLKKEVSMLCDKEKSSLQTQISTKQSAEELLEECRAKVSSKEIREYLISLGINPQELPGVTIQKNEYEPGQFQESVSISELGLDGTDKFSVENISSKFEQILALINEKYPIQFIEGDWVNRFAELSPNEDEVEVLNKFIALLPAEVKPVPLANALTGIIALKKYSEMDISELSEAEKVILNANVQAVLAVTSPELIEGSLSLVLPEGLMINGEPLETAKTYSSVKVDRAVVKVISEAGVELPIELVSDMQEVYSDFQLVMVEMKEKAENQEHPKRKARLLKRYEQYALAFDSMSIVSKVFVLEIMKLGQEESKLKNDRLMQNALNVVKTTFVDDWNEESYNSIGAYADYLIKKGIPENEISKIFFAMLDEKSDIMDKIIAQAIARGEELNARGEELDIEIAEGREEIAEGRERIVKLDSEIAELKVLLDLQKQILGAKKGFEDKTTTVASL